MIRIISGCLLIVLLVGCATTADVRTLARQGNVEALIEIINESHDKDLRIEAITALGSIRDPRSIGALTKALNSDSWIERETAVKSLARLRDHLVVQPIVSTLNDENKFVRDTAHKSLIQVSESLGKQKDPRVIRHLFNAMRDNNSTARETCVEAFRVSINELSRVREPTFVNQLIKALSDDNKYVRQAAASALGQFDDPRVIEPLTIAMKDPSLEVRDAASASLRNFQNPKSADPLFEALQDKDATVRDEAAGVLGQYKDPQVINKIILSLSDQNHYVRAGAAKAMGTLLHPRAMQQLIVLLDDPYTDVRLAASETLEKYHWRPGTDAEAAKNCVAKQSWSDCAKYKDEAIAPLIIALNGEDSDVRREASLVLTQVGWSPKDDIAKGSFCVAKKDWEECKALGSAAVPALIQELNSENWKDRIHAVDTLAYIKDPQSIEPLIALVDDSNADVRIAVVESIAGYKDVRVVAPLLKALDDNNRSVRKSAESVLNKSIGNFKELHDPQVTKPFLDALQDNNRGVRLVAARLLGELKDPEAAPALVVALDDVDTDVRIAAKDSLYKIKDTRAINTLVAALKDKNPEVRSDVVGALSEYKDYRAIEPLLESASDANADVRIKTIKALAKIDDPRAVQPLVNALKDYQPSVRLAAASSLKEINDPRAEKALKESLSDFDVDVRMEVRNSLLAKSWEPATEVEQAHYCIAKRDWLMCEKIGKPAIKPLLLELKQNESPYQVEAARVLGEIRDPSTIQPLIDAIASTQWMDDEFKRNSIIDSSSRALKKFGIQAAPALKDTLTQWYISEYTVDILDGIGWKPRTNDEEIHYLVAKRAHGDLQALWVDTKKVLLKDIDSKDPERISNALYAFIGMGREEVINDLLKLLDNHGTVQIAEAYLNSGNDVLINGAKNWTANRGLVVNQYSNGNSPVEWGKL